MRQIRYSVAMSLDGYIAGPKGEADWIVMDPEIDFAAIFARYDTFLLGRKTYEQMRAQGGGGGGTAGVKTYVFSTTLRASDHPKVTIVAEKAKERLAALKKEPGKDIWLFGGGSLFASLLQMKMVDAVEVAVMPVLLGGGIPLLPTVAKKTKLELTSHRLYAKSGTVMLEYAVA